MAEIAHSVRDGRNGLIGAWEIAPLDIDKLSSTDIGRTVIYRDHGRAEAGTLTSWCNGIVFARYSNGDTAAGANATDLVFGLRTVDHYSHGEDGDQSGTHAGSRHKDNRPLA